MPILTALYFILLSMIVKAALTIKEDVVFVSCITIYGVNIADLLLATADTAIRAIFSLRRKIK